MIHDIATTLITKLISHKMMISCAESCTGGLIMAALTDVSGASAAVDRGFVTYSNEAKMNLLGVQEETLSVYGAVSAETAYEMVIGALHESPHSLKAAISVTGIAGPNGGSEDKPVGTVWIGAAITDKEPVVKHYCFSGDRQEVRQKTTEAAIVQLLSLHD
ncbi:MAG: CinA family protein [Candidatus Puniceispirillaceae bacterium]